jgi:hypothetical protein
VVLARLEGEQGIVEIGSNRLTRPLPVWRIDRSTRGLID